MYIVQIQCLTYKHDYKNMQLQLSWLIYYLHNDNMIDIYNNIKFNKGTHYVSGAPLFY